MTKDDFSDDDKGKKKEENDNPTLAQVDEIVMSKYAENDLKDEDRFEMRMAYYGNVICNGPGY